VTQARYGQGVTGRVWGGTSEDERQQLLAGSTGQLQPAMASHVPAGAGSTA